MTQQKRIAFIFPGQGAQYPGMGKDFADHFPEARLTFEEANDLLGRNLSTVIFNGPEDLLTETRNSQLGIYVTSMALLRTLKKQFPDLVPEVCSGLSLGEYTALTAADYISFEQCLPLVQFRGQFMNDACEANKGEMAVVMGLEAEVVEKIVKEVNMPHDLWAANFNCPGQVVISGTPKGIAAGSEAAKAKGAKRVLPLQVHGAFHSGLMQQAEDRLREHIDGAPFRKGFAELVMNVPGDYVEDLEAVRHNLIKQVTSPVRWEQGIRAMAEKGIELFIEIGCGKTLTGMNKRIGIPAETKNIEKIADLDHL